MFRSVHPCICQFSMDVFSYSRGHWPAVFGLLGSPRTSHQFIVGGAGVPGEEPSDSENMFRSILEIQQFSSILILLMLSLIIFNDRKTVQIPPQIHQNDSLILSYFFGEVRPDTKGDKHEFSISTAARDCAGCISVFLNINLFLPLFYCLFFICLCTFNGNYVFLVQFCEHIFPVEENKV